LIILIKKIEGLFEISKYDKTTILTTTHLHILHKINKIANLKINNMIQFCPVCGKILQLKEENGKNIGVCSCGFKRNSGYELSASEKGEDKVISIGEGFVEDDKDKIEKLSYEDKKERKPDF
jgi:hypothetical protein